MVDETKYLFILSPSFSGSTLLTIMLSQHPEIASLGEFLGRRVDFRKNRADYCSCGEKLNECPAITELSDFILGEYGFHLDPFLPETSLRTGNRILGRSMDYPVSHDAVRRTAGRMIHALPAFSAFIEGRIALSRAAAGHYAAVQGAGTYLDSSKKAIRAYYFRKLYPDLTYVVLLTRDGRATSSSIMKNLGIESIEKAGRIWRNTLESKQHLFDSFPENRRRLLKYEELCSEPERALTPVFEMLGVASHHISNRIDPSEHHISGNRMCRKGEQEITLREEWKHALTERQQDEFQRDLGHLNGKYGYPSM